MSDDYRWWAEQQIAEEPEWLEEGPQDDDWITSDYRTFRLAGFPGRSFTLGENEDWRTALLARMAIEDFYPNVWYAEERGGFTLLSTEAPDAQT
jgi:hypothetical protein